jgi:EAL domain-containing protein (putative c-di-GMP-specific phosphodiesterase class I)
VRWRRADGSLTGPNEFIAFAEERGLIGSIGRWVLAEACRQNKEWQDAGLPKILVAVNVSPVQFKGGSLVADVERVLRQTGLEGRYLEIELTEGALMSDSPSVTGKFATLRALGVTMSIDDFGTGYSSLSYLKRLRVDKLKIDRAFVRDIETDADDVAIAFAIVQMGRTLNLTVLAEGVENEAQLNMLRAQGCNEYQGFLLSRPLPAAEAGELLRRYRDEMFSATTVMEILRPD